MANKRISFALHPTGETNGFQTGMKRTSFNPSKKPSTGIPTVMDINGAKLKVESSSCHTEVAVSPISPIDENNGAKLKVESSSCHTEEAIPGICSIDEKNGGQHETNRAKQVLVLPPLHIASDTDSEIRQRSPDPAGQLEGLPLEIISGPREMNKTSSPTIGSHEKYTPYEYNDWKMPANNGNLPGKTPNMSSIVYNLATEVKKERKAEDLNEHGFGKNNVIFNLHSPAQHKLGPLILVYNIQLQKFYKDRQKNKIRQDLEKKPLMELHYQNPPLLVDGRMQMIEIEKWERKLTFFWRKPTPEDRRRGSVVVREAVTLPTWAWVQRNFGGRYKELWIERRKHDWETTGRNVQGGRLLELDDGLSEEERRRIDGRRVKDAGKRYSFLGKA